jgi:hypothetical protein
VNKITLEVAADRSCATAPGSRKRALAAEVGCSLATLNKHGACRGSANATATHVDTSRTKGKGSGELVAVGLSAGAAAGCVGRSSVGAPLSPLGSLMQLTTGIENFRRLKNHLSANRKLTLRTRTLFALALAASRARRRVGVLWGFGRNSGCRASGDHHTSTL